MKIVAIMARILLGLVFFVFGLNPSLKFLPMPLLEGVWGRFLVALFVHFVWLVGATQVVSGALFLIGPYLPLAIVLSAYHVTMQPHAARRPSCNLPADSLLALARIVCTTVDCKA